MSKKAEAEVKTEKLTTQDIVNIVRARSDNPSAERMDLSGKDLSGINFTTLCRRENKSDFRGALFTGSNLKGANLSGLSLQGCDFHYANIEDADFTGCDLEYATGLING